MSVKIPQELQEFLKGKPGWIATASKDGTPNVSIKGSLRVLDAEHLLFADIFSKKTRANLLENPKVAIMVYEETSRRGIMFKGTAKLHARGPLYDQTSENMKTVMPQLPVPQYVVEVTVESIHDQSAGPNGQADRIALRGESSSQPMSMSGTPVRGKPKVVDGPFPDAKEVIEIRQVQEMADFPDDIKAAAGPKDTRGD